MASLKRPGGRKLGFKRSDRRFQSDDGQLWDSQFEFRVYDGLRSSGYRLRRCDESDSIAYNTTVKQGRCVECGGAKCVQERIYTPDLFVVEDPTGKEDQGRQYYIECKGYFPADKRALLRAVASQRAGVDLRILFEREVKLKGTVGTNIAYVHKMMKGVPVGTYDKTTQGIVWHEPPKS